MSFPGMLSQAVAGHLSGKHHKHTGCTSARVQELRGGSAAVLGSVEDVIL